jgi:hypothetical protein
MPRTTKASERGECSAIPRSFHPYSLHPCIGKSSAGVVILSNTRFSAYCCAHKRGAHGIRGPSGIQRLTFGYAYSQPLFRYSGSDPSRRFCAALKLLMPRQTCSSVVLSNRFSSLALDAPRCSIGVQVDLPVPDLHDLTSALASAISPRLSGNAIRFR